MQEGKAGAGLGLGDEAGDREGDDRGGLANRFTSLGGESRTPLVTSASNPPP